MRPDEHKRKKNAQYKKKHGIKSEDHGKKENIPKSESGKPHMSVKSDPPVRLASSKPTNDVTSACKPAPEVLPSNWERYDIADEPVSQRGTDFNLLLQGPSNAFSQFRFKDEQSWLDAEDSFEPSSDFLSIDFNEIAAALACIPLHKRLGIEADKFEESEIKEFETDAAIQRKQYMKHQAAEEERASVSDSCVAFGDVDIGSLVTSLLSSADEDTEHDLSKQRLSDSEVSLKQMHCVNTKNGSSKPVEEVSSFVNVEDTVLDDILALSDPVTNQPQLLRASVSTTDNDPSTHVKDDLHQSRSCAPSEVIKSTQDDVRKTSNIEDELDFLLSIEDKPMPVPDGMSKISPSVSQEPRQTAASLEDWLESVLDD